MHSEHQDTRFAAGAEAGHARHAVRQFRALALTQPGRPTGPACTDEPGTAGARLS